MRPDVYGSLSRFLDWLVSKDLIAFSDTMTDEDRQRVLGEFVGEGGLK